MRALALLAAAGLLAIVAAAPARADGDPASDYLLGSKVFLPYDAKFPPKQAAQFGALVAAANRAGFAIRVAIVSSAYDMGSVTTLWRKPRTYARFLGFELSFVYKQRLLVVMPNGMGFNWPRHTPTAEYALLAKIPIGPTPAELLTAATKAVTELASAGGVHAAAPAHVTTPGRRNSNDREVILAAVLGALALAAASRSLIKRLR